MWVTGHADLTGSDERNQTVSLYRAKAVRTILAERGLDPAKIRIFGAGTIDPLQGDRPVADPAANRRVDVGCQP